MNAYKMDFASKTLTITKDFADAAANPASKEYKLIRQFQKDFPDLSIIRKTHKTPSVYRTKQGEIFRCNQFKNLTYSNMERFINALPQRDKIMAAYTFVKDHAAVPQSSRYAAVRRWFMAQFPLIRTDPLYYLEHDFKIMGIATIEKEMREAA